MEHWQWWLWCCAVFVMPLLSVIYRLTWPASNDIYRRAFLRLFIAFIFTFDWLSCMFIHDPVVLCMRACISSSSKMVWMNEWMNNGVMVNGGWTGALVHLPRRNTFTPFVLFHSTDAHRMLSYSPPPPFALRSLLPPLPLPPLLPLRSHSL